MSGDQLARCTWVGIADPVYMRYHDTEWGVPKTRDIDLFEKLILEGFQSGLSWITILKKRDNFRRAAAFPAGQSRFSQSHREVRPPAHSVRI